MARRAVGCAPRSSVMVRALITRDFDLAYVQQVGSRSTPVLYNVTALWSALEGSILLWLAIARRLHGRHHAAVPQAPRRSARRVGAGGDVRRHRVLLPAGVRPGRRVRDRRAPASTDGPGPNPLLQNHILVLFHPPILYLGYVGFTVPFAFAIAALVTGRVGEGWLMETRRWALFAWGFLTIGILLGGWWSYEVLGWGGVWGVGPGRERQLPAVAHRHRVHPLGARAGAPRHAARVEHQPADRDVRADDPRHVPHPQRRHPERARVLATAHRAVPARRSSG